MKTHLRVLMAVVATSVAAAGSRAGAEEKSWVGESVLYTKPAKDIEFGDRVDGKQIYFTFSGIWPIKVRDEREGWLRIHDGHREGWVHKEDFVLVRDGPAYFHRRVQANPKDGFALSMRGAGWLQKGEPDNAIKDFEECIRLDPTDLTAFNSRGNAWLAKKEYDKAIRDYDEAIRLDPKYALAFRNRGIGRANKKEYDGAIQDYDEAIRLDPKYALAFFSRGIAWANKKEYDRAIQDYDEAIRLDPKNASAFNSRGNAWQRKKEYDRAIRDYDEAIRLDPKDALAHLNRSVAQMLMRRPEAASGFQAVLDLQGWKGHHAPYAVILGHFAGRQAGDKTAAIRFLDDSAGKLNDPWPYPVVRFLRGEIDDKALLALATDDDKRTEAHCYLGLDKALKGHKDDAQAHFRWVKEHGNTNFFEYTIAIAELDGLERAPGATNQ